MCAICAYGSQNMESCDIRGCDNRDAIKALEQEPIIDKINNEISHLAFKSYEGRDTLDRKDVLAILDKYREVE